MRRFSFKYWWHYIPIIVVALGLCVCYVEPFWGIFIASLLGGLTLLILVWLIYVFIRSWQIGGTHRQIVTSLFAIEMLALVFFLFLQLPSEECSLDEMAEHYEKSKTTIEELISFTQSAMDENYDMYLEFERGKVSIFRTTNYSTNVNNEFFISDSLKQEIMEGVGLDNRELNTIQKLLARCKCISIETSFPDYCDIGFKRVFMGMYSYRIFLSSMTDEQKQVVLENGHFVPYNDKMVMKYGGGAVGPDEFTNKEKEEYLQKHPFHVSASSE